jgi:hypothetical protein
VFALLASNMEENDAERLNSERDFSNIPDQVPGHKVKIKDVRFLAGFLSRLPQI